MLLVERKEAIRTLDSLLSEVAGGQCVIAALCGPTATGKTVMLHDLSERAGLAGTSVLNATCSHDEQEHSYGVLGQLFNLEVRGDQAEMTQRLHAAAVGLVKSGPLMIVLDDVQFADAASIRCLRFLARRMAFQPLSIVVAWDAGLGQTPLPEVQEFVYGSGVHRLQLKPLTREGVGQLVAGRAGPLQTQEVIDEVCALSGGNPMLVNALLDDQGTARPGADGVVELTVGPAYQHAVIACVRNVDPPAVRVARGIAILGGAADVPLVSKLSGTDPATVRRAAKILMGVGILDGARFRHPLTRTSILNDTPVDVQYGLRRRAACLLYKDGAPARLVAEQLVGSGSPLPDWALAVLREAARDALTANDVPRAIACLELARDCPATPEAEYEIKVKLTQLRWLREPGNSAARFVMLKEPILEGKVGTSDALNSALALLWHLRSDDALKVFEHLLERGEDTDPALRTAQLMMSAIYPGIYAELLRRRPATASPASHPAHVRSSDLRLAESLSAVLKRTADEQSIAQVEQILQDEGLSYGPLGCAAPALLTLIYAERLESADAWCNRLLAEANHRGTPTCRLMLLGFRSTISFRQGRLVSAAEHARTALAEMEGHDWNISRGHAIAALAEASTAMGEHDAAAECFAVPVPKALFQTVAGLHYLCARGQHHLALNRTHAARADFAACGELMAEWDLDLPSVAPWRLGAAENLLLLGETEQAAGLIEEQLARSERAPDGIIHGMALRLLAGVRPAPERPALLRKAFEILLVGGSHYEAARALADLSRALDDRSEARIVARRAWRMAKSCQAEKLCQSIMPKQAAAKKAVPDPAVPDDDRQFANLSFSERRVAGLAAQGYTNREIGNRLFVTISTVEQHLTRIYRKMNIRNRDELPARLWLNTAETP